MTKIHLVDGEKGGVGKSLFARVLIEYCIEKKLSYKLVDTDRTNPDVGQIYQPKDYCSKNKGFKQIFFSEDEKKSYSTDKIFEWALKTPVIVNLPAQVYPLVTDWIEKNNLLTLGAEHGVEVCKWFVCTGGYDSVTLFIESLRRFEGRLPHVLVRNGGLCDSWSHLDGHEDLQNLIKRDKVPVIDFPKFGYLERNLIDEKKWTFATAAKSNELGIISKQRLKIFLDKAYAAIESAGILSPIQTGGSNGAGQ